MLCEKGVITQHRTTNRVHQCGEIRCGEIGSGEIGSCELKCDTINIGGLDSTKVQTWGVSLNDFICQPSLNFRVGGGRRRRRKNNGSLSYRSLPLLCSISD